MGTADTVLLLRTLGLGMRTKETTQYGVKIQEKWVRKKWGKTNRVRKENNSGTSERPAQGFLEGGCGEARMPGFAQGAQLPSPAVAHVALTPSATRGPGRDLLALPRASLWPAGHSKHWSNASIKE